MQFYKMIWTKLVIMVTYNERRNILLTTTNYDFTKTFKEIGFTQYKDNIHIETILELK